MNNYQQLFCDIKLALMNDIYKKHNKRINEIARIKGLKRNRSLRIAIQKGKYIAREISVKGGKTYEILYSSVAEP